MKDVLVVRVNNNNNNNVNTLNIMGSFYYC